MSFIYEILPERIINAMGWTILHSFWQGLVIGIFLFLLLYFYRGHSSNLRYHLSVFSLILTCGLFFITFIIYCRYNGRADFIISQGTRVSGYIDGGINPSPMNFGMKHNVSNSLFGSIAETIPGTFPFMITFWLFGVFVIIVRMTGGFFTAQRLRNSCLYGLPEEIQEKLRKLLCLMKVDKLVAIFESTLVHVPVVIGFFKPIILLPFSAVSQIPCDQIEAIIAHELAHIRRNDYLVNVFQSITEALFFYHPVIWIINRRIRKERENCCDDLAVMYSGGRITYAKALASIYEIPAKHGFPILAMASKKYHMLSRILRILKQGKMKTNLKDKLTAGFILLSALIIILLNTGGSFINFNSTPDYDVQKDYLKQTGEKTFSVGLVDQNPENLVIMDQSARVNENIISNNPVEPSPVNEPDFSSFPESLPEIVPESDILVPVHPDTSLKVKDNIVHRTFVKDGTVMDIKMRIEKGEVRELYVNGEKIPVENYGQYQAEIDKTMEDLAELQEELTEAREKIEKIDMEEMRKEIEASLKDVQKSLQEIDIEAMVPDIEQIEVPEIDEEQVRIEIENAIAKIEEIDMEKIHVEIEKAVQSACEAVKDIELPDMEEIKLEMEKAVQEMEEIDHEKIRADIEKSISEMKVDREEFLKDMEKVMKELKEINIDDLKVDIEREKVKMDEMLKELEKLEIDRK
jgi:bla regulator protein BlaR1